MLLTLALYMVFHFQQIRLSNIFDLLKNVSEDVTRSILSLPCRLGGMGMSDPSRESLNQYEDSIFILSILPSALNNP